MGRKRIRVKTVSQLSDLWELFPYDFADPLKTLAKSGKGAVPMWFPRVSKRSNRGLKSPMKSK